MLRDIALLFIGAVVGTIIFVLIPAVLIMDKENSKRER